MKIHMVAVCGTGMGSLAGLLKEAGHEVRGSDKAFYPPMSNSLKEWGIPTVKGFDAKNVQADTDLVVVGNACRKDNPEASYALEKGMKVMSFPQTLSEMFISGKRSLVIAGTHGKTTTTSLMSYILVNAGRDPGFLVGGIPANFKKSFRLGHGKEFVVEGDEYDSAFFDKRPKFVHYRPQIVTLTSMEFDHADIYKDMDAYRESFATLVSMIPENGLLVAFADDPEVMEVSKLAKCQVMTYGMGKDAMWRISNLSIHNNSTTFDLTSPAESYESLTIPMAGEHNAANALACMVMSNKLGILPPEAQENMRGFEGIARRMQVRGEKDGVLVIDDFAHHPTEVLATLKAARQRWPSKHLVAVFEPRTNTSRRNIFQERYAHSFGSADEVLIVPPFGVDSLEESERFDSQKLVDSLRATRQDAKLCSGVDEVLAILIKNLKPDSVVLIMSNGAFDNIHQRLLDALGSREG